MKKRIIGFMLVIGILLTVLPASAFAASGTSSLCHIETENCSATVDGHDVQDVSPGTVVTFWLDFDPMGDEGRFLYYVCTGNGISGKYLNKKFTFDMTINKDVKVEALFMTGVPSYVGYDLLWFESFEDGIPSDWANRDTDGDGNFWSVIDRNDNNGYLTADKTHAICSSSYDERPLKPDNQLISHIIQMEEGDLLSFSIISMDVSVPGDLLYVYLLSESGEKVPLGSWESGSLWDDIYVTIPVTGPYRIVFSHEQCTDFFKIILDAIGYWREPYAVSVLDVFKDVTDNWALEGIQYCFDHDLMTGTGSYTFSPNGAMTRGMFATVLWNQAGKPEPRGTSPFTDFTKNYYRKAIAWAYENGVVNGVTATTFRPDQTITREQVAAILYRYAEKILKADVSASDDISVFPDYNDVSNYARKPLSWAKAEGIITGSKDGGQVRLLPGRTATRAQGAKMLMVFSKNFFSGTDE